jgi:FAD/FMN-containing dehydrogenase
VHRVHLDGDPDRVVADADALILAARMVGGSARIERRADALRDRLATWPASPQGAAMMRRIKDEFDPKGVLEPGRAGLVG